MFGRRKKIGKLRFSYGQTPTHKQAIKRQNPRWGRIKKLFTVAFATAIIALGIYGISFSSFFNIKEITLAEENIGNQKLAAEIINSLQKNIGKNIIFTDTEKITDRILRDFPGLESAQIDKNYPATLTLDFAEHPLIANIIYENGNLKKTYVINSIGYAIKEGFENKSLPYIRIKSDDPLNMEKAVIEKNKLKYILDAIVSFENKFSMAVKEAVFKPVPRELHLLTEQDFYIWIDIQKPADEQLKKLKKALVKLDIYKESLQYIDLRIAHSNGEKIIYKRR